MLQLTGGKSANACSFNTVRARMQVLASLQRVCGWVRASSQYRVGSLLIAVRAGHVAPGVAGLVIAASASDKSLALQAVQAAVKQVEALGAHSKSMQGL